MNLLLIALVSSLFAQNYSKDMGFAQGINDKFGNGGGLRLSGDKVPGWKGKSIPKSLPTNSSLNEIKKKAQGAMQDSSQAEIFKHTSRERGIYRFNQTKDPMFKRLKKVQQNAHKLTATSAQYKGCVDLPVGEVSTKESFQYCDVRGVQQYRQYTCDLRKNPRCNSSSAGAIYFRPLSFHGNIHGVHFHHRGDQYHIFRPQGSPGGDFHNHIKIHIPSVELLGPFSISTIGYDDALDIFVNGNHVFRGVGDRVGGVPWEMRDFHRWREVGGNYGIRHFLKQGQNTIYVRNFVAGTGGFRFVLTPRFKRPCGKRIETARNCPSSGGQLSKRRCVDRRARVSHRGFSFKTPDNCWRYEETYSLPTGYAFDVQKSCKSYVDRGCSQVDLSCVGQSPCKDKKAKFFCPTESKTRYVTMCGTDLICHNGDCTKAHANRTPHDAKEDFKRAMASLGLAQEIAKEYKNNDLRIFNGQPLTCKTKNFGFKNCCKLNGWGVSFGVAQCGTEAKELAIARSEKKTLEVGSYTTRRAKVFKTTHHVFCSYPSKLARIVMQQALPQLGRNLGSANAPNCQGIAVKDIAKVNLDGIDLSELFEEMKRIGESARSKTMKEIENSAEEHVRSRIESMGERQWEF